MKIITLILAAAATITPARAMISITNPYSGAYNFNGQTNSTALTTNVSASTFTLSSELQKVGVASSSAVDRFMASQWSTNSLDTTTYIELTLTLTPAPSIPFTYFDSLQLDFALRRSSTGPRQFEWRSSLDGFATPIMDFSSLNPSINLTGGVLTVPDTASTETFGGNTFLLSGPSLLNVSTITLRLYAYQAESPFGQAGLDTPLSFSGNAVVPEPSTAILIAFSIFAGACLKIRLRK
jgi:hypothetical protein